MMRWFRASFEGSYVGTDARVAPSGGRRHKLQVYRAALRDLVWADPPDTEPPWPIEAEATASRAFYQAQVDQAHVTGVRGPGTYYEGPVFNLRVWDVQLSHPTQNKGRAYGHMRGQAVGRLELPKEPEPPEVIVHEVTAPAAPLDAALFKPHTDSGVHATRASAAGDHETDTAQDHNAARADGEHATRALTDARNTRELDTSSAADAERDALSDAEQTAAPDAQSGSLLPLTALVVVIGLGLFVACGVFPLGLWALFMLPTLAARKLFRGLLGDSAYVRGFGYALIVVQVLCISPLLSRAWSGGCPSFSLLPMLGAIAVLFPAGIMASSAPITCTSVGLALVLSTWCRGPIPGGQDERCASSAVSTARDIGEASGPADLDRRIQTRPHRAVLVDGQADGALELVRRDSTVRGEREFDVREGRRHRICARALDLNLQAFDRLLLFAQNVQHIHRAAGGERRQQRFHRSHAAALAADVRRAIDDETSARSRARLKSSRADLIDRDGVGLSGHAAPQSPANRLDDA